MRKLLFAIVLCLALPLTSPVSAQTPPSTAEAPSPSAAILTIPTPAAWEEKTLTPDDYRTKAFVNPQTESSIEVFSKKLEHVELANSLFTSFDHQLISISFEKNATATAEMTFTLKDETKVSGVWNENAYTNRDIRINTVTFTFTLQDYAFIIVGYFSPAERETGIDVLKSLIKSIEPQSVADAPTAP